jgi:4-amino-4-deoxy-L-arabinose transferase
MLASGDWLTPTLHHEVPHFTKPPLTYWALASSLALFGRNEWAARLPNSLAFLATALLVHRLARRLAPGREALATAVWATSLFPFVAANVVTTDTLLTLFETMAVAGWVEHHFTPGRPRAPLVWTGVGFGLGFLTKGPPALLPALAIYGLTLRREGVPGLRRLHSARGILVFALLGLSWFALEIWLRRDLFHYLMGAEVEQRLASDAFDRNAGLAGLARAYLGLIPVAMLPWLPWALGCRLRARHERPAAGDAAGEFLVWWLLLPTGVFFLSSSRQPLYLLPLAVPAALWIARALPADALAPRRRRWALAGWIALLLALKAVAAAWPTDRDGRRLAAGIRAALPGGSPRELVIVNRKPRYSLALYFDAEVERISLETVPILDREPAYRPVFEPLGHELAEGERGRIWLVPKRLEQVYVDELRALGWWERPLVEIEGMAVYADPDRHPDPPEPRPPRRHPRRHRETARRP